jgi:hypothetical protein
MKLLIPALAAMLVLTGSAAAQQLLESYQARLGVDDHYNSNGVQLTDPAAIIRQDRANFHEFGIRDPEDEGDRFFAVKANRARLEAMLRAGRMDRFTRNAIRRGTPLVLVEIYRNFVVVTAAR